MAEIKFDLQSIPEFQSGKAYVVGRGRGVTPTVRIVLPDGTETALCTSAYNYNMSYDMQSKIAERLAALWNSQR